jgi:hypothetical protein
MPDEGAVMSAVLRLVKERVRKAAERDRRSERHVGAISRRLWPWNERWLIALAGLLALLDYATTCAALELSGKGYSEGGLLAGWALRIGGFGWLFLVDMGAVFALALLAVIVRALCLKFGFRGYGRATFVVLLLPYAVVAFAAVVNNIVLTLL